MSGLFGVVGFDGGVDVGVVELMGEAGLHRGPDGMGVWTGDGAGLGCLELWISPESVGETGPWVAEDVVVAADVRLDNRSELIRSLGAAGGVSDRELLGLAYRRWGENCAERLLGDFAFVVYDRIRHRVFAARDVMGMRPLYYRSEPGRFLFGSEVKQILAVPDVPVRIFEPAVAGYLAGGVTRLEWTFYEDINQLLPGHSLVVSDHGSRIRRYWDIDPENQIRYSREQDYADHFRELFIEAVRCRTRTDYPVGIFLSGGVDSGSIASTVGWLRERGEGPQDFRAYTWAFEQLPQCDERHLSRLITDHYQIPTTDIWADQAWPLKDYPKHGPDPDEPYIGVYQALIEQTLHTAQTHNTKLMLSGDRGDLLVGGFTIDYVRMAASRRVGDLLSEIRVHHDAVDESYRTILIAHLMRPMLRRLRTRSPLGWLRWALDKRRADANESDLGPAWLAMDLQNEWLPDQGEESLVREFPQPTQRTRYEWVFTPLHMRGMVWSNRTYALFGQDFADPWSDRRLAEFVLSIPQQVLNRPRELRKRLVRRSMKGIMPDRFRNEAAKIIPRPLYERALKTLATREIESLLEPSLTAEQGWVDGRLLRQSYHQYLAGAHLDPSFWWALTTEMWLRAERTPSSS